MELILLHKGGSVCYVSSPCMKLPALLTVQPSILLVDTIDCAELVSQIETAIATRKPSLQQQLWKSYIQNVKAGSFIDR